MIISLARITSNFFQFCFAKLYILSYSNLSTILSATNFSGKLISSKFFVKIFTADEMSVPIAPINPITIKSERWSNTFFIVFC